MVRFSPENIPEINAWYCLRGMEPLNKHLFPDVGFIVSGVCAGFIYQTDSALCFLDGYVSNPDTTKEQRKEAFDKITTALILTAKDHGFTSILAYIKNPEIAKRCERFGFGLRGTYNLFVKGV